MTNLASWQWAIGLVVITLALVLGGWWMRQREPQDSELLREELSQREAELQDAREEAELIILQLHQVQEELEHYFLESRSLQQQLEEQQHSSVDLARLQVIKQRLIALASTAPDPSSGRKASEANLMAIINRQQQSLRRFYRLHVNHK